MRTSLCRCGVGDLEERDYVIARKPRSLPARLLGGNLEAKASTPFFASWFFAIGIAAIRQIASKAWPCASGASSRMQSASRAVPSLVTRLGLWGSVSIEALDRSSDF